MTSFLSATAITKFQAELPQWGIKYGGVGKICDIRKKSSFISETV